MSQHLARPFERHSTCYLQNSHYSRNKNKAVAFDCIVPSSCRINGVCVEDRVVPEIEIPVPAVSVFCFAANRVVMAVLVT